MCKFDSKCIPSCRNFVSKKLYDLTCGQNYKGPLTLPHLRDLIYSQPESAPTPRMLL